jgi:hypothetical protein
LEAVVGDCVSQSHICPKFVKMKRFRRLPTKRAMNYLK